MRDAHGHRCAGLDVDVARPRTELRLLARLQVPLAGPTVERLLSGCHRPLAGRQVRTWGGIERRIDRQDHRTIPVGDPVHDRCRGEFALRVRVRFPCGMPATAITEIDTIDTEGPHSARADHAADDDVVAGGTASAAAMRSEEHTSELQSLMRN